MGSGEFHFFLKFTKKMLFSSFQVLLLISPQQWYLLWLATCSPAARLHHRLAFRNYSHTVYAVQAYAWPVRRCTAMTTYTYTRVRTLARIVQYQQSASMQEVCKKRTAMKNDGVLSRNAARSFRFLLPCSHLEGRTVMYCYHRQCVCITCVSSIRN